MHLIVGAADLETWEINYPRESVQYMDGINDTGRTRIERNTALRQNLREARHCVPHRTSCPTSRMRA